MITYHSLLYYIVLIKHEVVLIMHSHCVFGIMKFCIFAVSKAKQYKNGDEIKNNRT